MDSVTPNTVNPETVSPETVTPPVAAETYDRLEAIPAEAWRLLTRGVRDRRCPFHTPVIATSDASGMPDARVVVLRRVDPTVGRIAFHTDARSPKLDHLAHRPEATAVFYDPGWKLQLRLHGRAMVHCQDEVARTGWEKSQAMSRRCYLAVAAPGSATDGPTSGLPEDIDGLDGKVGWPNFAVVQIAVERFDWLYLASHGHRRARFSRSPDGTWQGFWCIP